MLKALWLKALRQFFNQTSLNISNYLAAIKPILRDYHDLISRLETEKIDLEHEVARKDYEARTLRQTILYFVQLFFTITLINKYLSINLTLYN